MNRRVFWISVVVVTVLVFLFDVSAQQQGSGGNRQEGGQDGGTKPAAFGNIYSMYGTIICSSADDPVRGYYDTCDKGSDEHGPIFYAVSSNELGYIMDTMDALIAEHLTESHTTCDAAQAFLTSCCRKLRFTFPASLHAELKTSMVYRTVGSIQKIEQWWRNNGISRLGSGKNFV